MENCRTIWVRTGTDGMVRRRSTKISPLDYWSFACYGDAASVLTCAKSHNHQGPETKGEGVPVELCSPMDGCGRSEQAAPHSGR